MTARRPRLQPAPETVSAPADGPPISAGDPVWATLEHAAIGLADIALDGDWLRVNPRLCATVGYTPEELLSRNWFDITHPEDQASDEQQVQRLLAGEIEAYSIEKRLVTRDGVLVPVNMTISLVRAAGDEPAYFIGVIEDIGERKQAEEDLKKERDFVSAVLDTVGSLVVVLDRQGDIVRFNRACERLTGYLFEEVRGKNVGDSFLAPEEAESVRNVFDRLVAGDFPNTFENYWVAKDGSRRLISWSNTARLDADGQVEFVIGTGIDITERRRAEVAQREATAQLRALSSRLLEVQEEERRRIARDLHDEIGQILTGLKLSLDVAQRRATGRLQEDLGQAVAQVQEVIAAVRELSLLLRPAMLDDLGLLPSLVWLVERYTAQTGVRVRFEHASLQNRLTPEIETAVYRIVQEALTNVARHAQTSDVALRVRVEAGRLHLDIEDQGSGFDPAASSTRGQSSGLAGMRERVSLLGGTFSLVSAAQAGTLIRVQIPLPQTRASSARREASG